jgi:hypothetical protein
LIEKGAVVMSGLRRIRWGGLLLVGLAFVSGLVMAGPRHSTQAVENPRDGFDNMVLEITASGAGLNVRESPNDSARVLDQLFWGDRVLWTGQSASAGGYRWLKVAISDGRTGWMVDVRGWTITMDPVYTTPDMGVGAMVRVTGDGDASHCRALPSASSNEYETMRAGDQITVIGGPYQAEYWMWWRYRLSSGYQCWIVDVPGWFNVVTPGTF